jgi:hypothetical protein
VAAGVGYCAIDRRREPLTGAEQRPCWTSGVGATAEGLFSIVATSAEISAAPRGLLELDRRPL